MKFHHICCFVFSMVCFFCDGYNSALAAPIGPETVLLKCGDPLGNNQRLEHFLKNNKNIKVAFATEKDAECDVILHHAIEVSPSVDILGPGNIEDELPNSSFQHWSKGDHYHYRAPTFGDPSTYSGTGGLKIEHANCWVSNVWGLFGSGVINREFNNARNYLNWVATSIKPPINQCGGDRIKCLDDPDATGFHHVIDARAHKVMREGTAGHDLSQMLPVSEFYKGWITVRIRVRLNEGNNKFYFRVIQGFGKKSQMNMAVSQTLPGITIHKTGDIFDYVLFVNLDAQNKKLSVLENEFRGLAKYAQFTLTSAQPQFDHNLDVFRVSLYRGIGALDSSTFGSIDSLVVQRGKYCN